MKKDNICALATASGMGAISIIRVSGPDAIAICGQLFKSVKKGKSLLDQKSHTIHLGTFTDNDNLIDQVLADSGLPDVTDASDFEAVANKAKRDARIDTAGYDRFSVEKQIIESCKQLGITTANRTLSSLSGTLLRNMNKNDRDEIQKQLDLNQSADTLS